MLAYIARRLLLIIPTLLGIMIVNFLIVQAAPGGPVEQMIAKVKGDQLSATARVGGSGQGDAGLNSQQLSMANDGGDSQYRGAQGLDPEFIKELEIMFGFDKPLHERFVHMMWSYMKLDFGESYYRDVSVIDLVLEKMPVSITLGVWSTLLIYLIAIPLGIKKAVKDGEPFDIWTSAVVIVGYAIPSFLFAVLLIVVFAGGKYLDWFPLRGLTSEGYSEMSFWAQIKDYIWHITLPITALVIGGFAYLTMLTKNSFLDEITKPYVLTARSKGLSEGRVLYRHVFRNAMLIIVAGFPAAFLSMFFTGAFLIEVIFSLDGLGLLGFEAIMNRDYPVVFGTLFIFTLLGLIMKLISDLTYVLIDPRIDFNARGA